MNIQGARGSKTFLAYQWLDSAVLCDCTYYMIIGAPFFKRVFFLLPTFVFYQLYSLLICY